VNKFLLNKNCNARHEGLSALEILMRVRGQQGGEGDGPGPVDSVLACADHFDPSIQRKAFSLLYTLADVDNVKVICSKLLEVAKKSEDDFLRKELVEKVSDLAERLSPNLEWRVRMMFRLMQCSTETRQREVLLEKMKVALESPKEDREEVMRKILSLLRKHIEANNGSATSGTVLRMHMWCLAHCQQEDAATASEKICSLLEEEESHALAGQKGQMGASDIKILPLRLAALDALFALVPRISQKPPKQVVNLIDRLAKESTSDLRAASAALELRALLSVAHAVDHSQHDGLGDDFTASYLDVVVKELLSDEGDKFADPFVALLTPFSPEDESPKDSPLKAQPYTQRMDETLLARISDPVSPAELQDARYSTLAS